MNNSLNGSRATSAILSHELRTPLNAIIGFSDLIIEEDSIGDIKIFADIIRESGLELLEKVLKVIDTIFLLDDNSQQIKRVDLHNLFNNINQQLIKDEECDNGLISFSMSKEAIASQFITDNNRLEKIIFSMVKCILRAHEKSKVYCNTYINYGDTNNANLLVGVSIDTPLSLDFCESFVRMNRLSNSIDYYSYKDGLGIDLAVCDFLAHLLNANLFIESTSAKTNFILSMPINTYKTNG